MRWVETEFNFNPISGKWEKTITERDMTWKEIEQQNFTETKATLEAKLEKCQNLIHSLFFEKKVNLEKWRGILIDFQNYYKSQIENLEKLEKGE